MVVHESLAWKRKSHGRPFRFLEYQRGSGQAVSGEVPDEQDERAQIPLSSPDLLAVNALGVRTIDGTSWWEDRCHKKAPRWERYSEALGHW